MPHRITDELVKALEAPSRGNRITYDRELTGFGVRVTAAGRKAFVLNYRVGGRERRYTVGRYPDLSVTAARELAGKLRREIDLGHDPMGARRKERTAPTMGDLAERYEREHLPRKRASSQRDDRGMLARDILPALGRLRVGHVTDADVDAVHRAITKRAPYRANRVVALLSKMFALAIEWGWCADNPAHGVARNPEHRRDRYLTPDELARLTRALAGHPDRSAANVIRLLMLTGARKGEVLSATWDQFDLDLGVWTKPSARTKRDMKHGVSLNAPAVELLKEMRAKGVGHHLFPGQRPGEPLRQIKSSWTAICREAGLSIRLHDVRHVHAGMLASPGESLPLIMHEALGAGAHRETKKRLEALEWAWRGADPDARELFLRSIGAKTDGKGPPAAAACTKVGGGLTDEEPHEGAADEVQDQPDDPPDLDRHPRVGGETADGCPDDGEVDRG